MMPWIQVNQLSDVYGESFFIFHEDKFRANFHDLNTSFNSVYHNTRVAYSYKTNYTPAICRIVDDMGGYAEVVSEMEYVLAKNLSVEDTHIIYNGPYKSIDSFRAALKAGTIVNLDSMRDYENLLLVAMEVPEIKLAVAIRCNFPLDRDKVSRFGFDVQGEEFREVTEGIRWSSNIRLSGLHCHFPNRDLESYGIRARQMLKLSRKLFRDPPDFLNLGGGFFGGMPASLQKNYKNKLPTFHDYAKLIGDLFNDAFEHAGKLPILFIEPGTALVANTFKFYTKVISKKIIRGHHIVTVAGSIFNISPTARLMNLPVTVLRQSGHLETNDNNELWDVAGYTCIETDYLTLGMQGPVDVGDFLVYENVGSYSVVMKPPFILPNVPILKKSIQNTDLTLIKRGETYDYIFQNFEN